MTCMGDLRIPSTGVRSSLCETRHLLRSLGTERRLGRVLHETQRAVAVSGLASARPDLPSLEAHYQPAGNHRQVTAMPRSRDGDYLSSVPSCAVGSCRSAGPWAWALQTGSLGRFGSQWPAIYGSRE